LTKVDFAKPISMQIAENAKRHVTADDSFQIFIRTQMNIIRTYCLHIRLNIFTHSIKFSPSNRAFMITYF